MKFPSELTGLDPLPFDAEALLRAADNQRAKLTYALSALGAAGPLVFDPEGLGSHFSTDLPTHSFHERPDCWAYFHEPQITGGLAHFLMNCDATERHKRIWAVLAALSEPPPFGPLDINTAFALNEADAGERRRIDLLIYARAGRLERAALVEAKFEHTLSREQLRSYERAGRQITQDCAYIVLAPALEDRYADILDRSRWSFLSWSKFVIRWERSLAQAEAQSAADFARFRRTIFYRASY